MELPFKVPGLLKESLVTPKEPSTKNLRKKELAWVSFFPVNWGIKFSFKGIFKKLKGPKIMENRPKKLFVQLGNAHCKNSS